MTLSLAGLSLRDLEYAAAVDRTRHFGRAAVGCAVSPAALSEQLRKLEDRLATRLFERGDRRVEPTPRGTALLRQIELVLSHAHGLLGVARASAGKGCSVLPALSTAGREGLAGLVAVRPLADSMAGRTGALAWRRTDPRGAKFLEFAAMLRDRLPEGRYAPLMAG